MCIVKYAYGLVGRMLQSLCAAMDSLRQIQERIYSYTLTVRYSMTLTRASMASLALLCSDLEPVGNCETAAVNTYV